MTLDATSTAMQPLPVGYIRFHRNRFIDYQINRIHAEGFTRLEDLRDAAARIHTFEDYVRVFTEHADRATDEGRWANAAFYLRAAEFFTPPGTEAKRLVYERFLAAFDRAFGDEGIERVDVPYGTGHLPASRLRARGGDSKGVILFFGGFDSLIEEFVAVWKRFAEAGFDVIAFEGPGQGGARTMYGQVFDHDWEKPVAAVLDHFAIREASLIGLSMGGYWALRAAAFEPRIARVVAWPPVYDWMFLVPAVARPFVKWMIRRRSFMRWSIRLRMRLAPILRHVVSQTLYIQGTSDDPADLIDWFLGMNAEHLHADRVRQDVLMVCGEHDAFQPPKLMRAQAKALVNARSITTRIFTAAEHADQHCQMGNLDLATQYVATWLTEQTEASRPSDAMASARNP